MTVWAPSAAAVERRGVRSVSDAEAATGLAYVAFAPLAASVTTIRGAQFVPAAAVVRPRPHLDATVGDGLRGALSPAITGRPAPAPAAKGAKQAVVEGALRLAGWLSDRLH